jgi:hypothetical protein
MRLFKLWLRHTAVTHHDGGAARLAGGTRHTAAASMTPDDEGPRATLSEECALCMVRGGNFYNARA